MLSAEPVSYVFCKGGVKQVAIGVINLCSLVRMLRIILLFVFLAGMVATYYFLSARQNPTISGAITIRRLKCSDGEAGSYFMQLQAENTTNQSLSQLVVQLTVGEGENRSSETLRLPRVAQGGLIEAEENIAFNQDIQVCFAKFYTHSGQQIRAIYRP